MEEAQRKDAEQRYRGRTLSPANAFSALTRVILGVNSVSCISQSFFINRGVFISCSLSGLEGHLSSDFADPIGMGI